MLDERQLKVCALLSQGIPITAISKEVGVSRQTVYDWKKLEEFAVELDRFGQEFISQMIESGKAYAPKAMAKLIYLCEHANSDKGKFDAASKIIDKYMSNATKIEISDGRDDKGNVTVDVLDDEIKEFDAE